ncbi:gas vesicle protein GvpA/GvpJ/GvpM family [Pseudonocardia sediminis]|uniref:Gas vesicle protein A n=1 Tax=Pseudonocardia sediminis TaxID=1397368 RepID=A0A4Q7V2L5_PSEST|nr:gas vesicle protein GvpJ [Pseudonocardia sediminis]RZT86883.1 gas vesicle protein GvpA/GvpJ/GvpM family [Pseudonocardia sediminis]
MTVSQRQGGSRVDRAPQGDLAQVIDLILDKGLVIDIFVKVSLVGIELVTIDARIVIASVDTYLRFAEATNRLDLHQKGGKSLTEAIGGMTESATHGGAKGTTKGVIEAGKEKFDDYREERKQEKRRS